MTVRKDTLLGADMIQTKQKVPAGLRLIRQMLASAMLIGLPWLCSAPGAEPPADPPSAADPAADPGAGSGSGSARREPAEATSSALSKPPFEPVDALRLVDPAQHPLRGHWSREDGAIVCADDPGCRLRIPYELPQYYELRLVVVRTRGRDALNVGIPVGTSHCFVSFDRHYDTYSSGLGRLDGRPSYFPNNETYHAGPVFRNDREHEIRILVRDRRIRATVDGRSVIRWSGDFARLTTADRELKDRRPQLLTWNTAYRIKQFTIVPGLELKASLADLRAFSGSLKERRWLIDREEQERELAAAFRDAVQTLLAEQRFADLDELAEHLRREKPRLPSAMPLQRLFYAALSSPLAGDSAAVGTGELKRPDEPDEEQLAEPNKAVTSWQERERRWIQQIRVLETWRQQRPMSLSAAICLTETLVSYAWHARGTGYVDRVTPRGWEDFSERLERAAKVLEEAKALGGSDVKLAHLRMVLGLALGHTRADLDAAFRDGVAIDPGYVPLFTVMATYLLPRWYGGPGDLEQFADQAFALTREKIGHTAYAYIALTVHSYHRFREFRDFKLSWDKVKQGFEDLLAEGYDTPGTLNRYCLLACTAGDRETAHRLFQRIDPQAPGSVWNARSFPRSRAWADPDSLRGDQRLVLEGHPEAVLAVAFAPDGRAVATAGTRGLVLLHDVAEGREKAAFPITDGTLPGIAFAPDGKTLAVSSYSGALYSLDLASGQAVELFKQPFALRQPAFSPDSRVLACASRDGAVIVWNRVTGERMDSIGLAHTQTAVGATFSSDSKSLISLGRNGDVKVWDWESRTLKHTFGNEPNAASLAVSADAGLVAVGLWERARVFRLPAGELVEEIPVPGSYATALAFDPRGQKLALGLGNSGEVMENTPILLWDLQRKALIKRLEGHRGMLWNVAFSPDGTQLASAANDRTARIWQVP